MAITGASGHPIALHVDSASPHEVTLFDKTIRGRFVFWLPKRIIGDKAYDSDPLDQDLENIGI